MKNKISILAALLFLFLGVSPLSAGGKILSIQSIDIQPYKDALNGFQSVCNRGMERIVLSNTADRDVIQEIRKTEPAVILAVGMDALEKIKDIREIPVIYLMVPNPGAATLNNRNFTGVRMNIGQEEQLSLFLKAAPSMRNIGLLYSEEKSGYLARRVVDSCKETGVNLIAREITSSRDVPTEIKALEGKIDGFWMLPDINVFSSEGIEYLFLFAMKNRVPILTFSDIHLESGALISVGVDPFDMGAQAGEMALKILKGGTLTDIPPVDARKASVSINTKIAGKLGITIDEILFPGARFLK